MNLGTGILVRECLAVLNNVPSDSALGQLPAEPRNVGAVETLHLLHTCFGQLGTASPSDADINRAARSRETVQQQQEFAEAYARENISLPSLGKASGELKAAGLCRHQHLESFTPIDKAFFHMDGRRAAAGEVSAVHGQLPKVKRPREAAWQPEGIQELVHVFLLAQAQRSAGHSQ